MDTNKVLVQKSQHIKGHVLCGDCEQLLNQKGENWVVRNAFTGTQFRLQQCVLAAQPISPTDDPRLIAYAGGEIDCLDMEKIAYFGVSLFWRASVHKWKVLDASIHNPLGSHEEALRQYLLGRAPLPRDITIHVYVSPHEDPWRSFQAPPLYSQDGLTSGRILLAGLAYKLKIGNVLPVDLAWCSYHSPQKFIYTSTTMDDVNAFIAIQTYLEQSGHNKEWSVRLVV